MKKRIPLENFIRPSAINDIFTIGSVVETRFNPSTETMVRHYIKPQSIQQAFRWIVNPNVTTEFDDEFYSTSEVVNKIFFSNSPNQTYKFHPLFIKLYEQLEITSFSKPDKTGFYYGFDEEFFTLATPIDIQEIPQIHLHKTFAFVFEMATIEVIEDLLFQLETLDWLDSWETTLINLMTFRIKKLQSEFNLIEPSCKRVTQLVKKCNIPNNENEFSNSEVALAYMCLFKTQEDFDEFIETSNDLDYFVTHWVIENFLSELPIIGQIFLKRVSTNPKTQQFLKDHLENASESFRERVRPHVTSNFKRWMIERGFIQASL